MKKLNTEQKILVMCEHFPFFYSKPYAEITLQDMTELTEEEVKTLNKWLKDKRSNKKT